MTKEKAYFKRLLERYQKVYIRYLALLTNTILILLAVLLSSRIKALSRRIPSILSGAILITLGILKFLELAFGT